MKLRTMLICIMLSLMSVSAFAGTITGKVTDASSQPLQGISVQVYNAFTEKAIPSAGITDATGNYSVTGIDAGSYKVIFFGKNSTGAPYVQQWYGGTSLSTATAVAVTDLGTNTDINGVLSTIAHPGITLASGPNVTTNVVKLPITLATDGAAVAATGMDIVFDTTKVIKITAYDPADPYQTVTPGPAAAAAGKGIVASKPAANTFRIGVEGSNTNVIGDGILAYVWVTLAGDTSSTISLTNTPSASDPSGSSVPVTGAASTISFPDLVPPTITTFTIPATSNSLVISPVTISASDNVGITGYLITDASGTPALTDNQWKASVPNSAVLGTQGVNKVVTLWVKDAAGNLVSKTATTTVDYTAPTVAFSVTSPSTSLTIPVSLSATDNTNGSGVTGYMITESNTTKPTAADSRWLGTAPTSYTASKATVTTLYAWAKDALGNVSDAKAASVVINLPDDKAPTVDSFTVPTTSTSATISNIVVTASDNIAVSGYLITESSTPPAANATGWTSAAPTSYTLAGADALPQAQDLSKTLYAWAKDAAGNVSAAGTGTSATVTVHLPDTQKPVVSQSFSVPATATTAIVNVSNFTATDNVGVTGYLLTESSTAPALTDNGWTASAPGSYSFSGLQQGVETTKTLYAWARDAAGNISDSRSGSVKITLNGPSVSFTAATLPDGTSTKNPALNLAGNVSGNGTNLKSVTIQVNSDPAIALTLDSNGNFNTAIVLVEGVNTITIVATDINNIATTVTRKITLDPNLADLAVTAPVTGSFTKLAIADVTGTVGAPQSTTVTVSVNGGAAVTVPLVENSFSAPVDLASGLNTITITANDTVSGIHTQSVEVTSDGAAPDLTVSAPADAFATPKPSVVISGTVTDVTLATVTISVDGGAPITVPLANDGKSFSYTVNLPTIKAYQLVITGTDQAGNSASVTRNVVRTYPSGNLTDGVSPAGIADVQKIMQFVLGLATPTADETIYGDVAPLSNGKPNPNGKIDTGDALVVLEKFVGTVKW